MLLQAVNAADPSKALTLLAEEDPSNPGFGKLIQTAGGSVGLKIWDTASPYEIYVRPDGNDENDGSADDAAHAFLTIDRAFKEATRVHAIKGGYHPRINLADGTYDETVYLYGPPILSHGSGFCLELQGNDANPQNVVINRNIDCWRACYSIHGITCNTLTSYLGAWVNTGAMRIKNFAFATQGSYMSLTGVLFGTTNNDGYVNRAALIADRGATLEVGALSVTNMTGPAFAEANFGRIDFTAQPTGTFIGKRYHSDYNGAISTPSGSGGANYLPGNASGTTANGGVYA